MSIILGKYKNKRKLGKGAYGDVLLVEDANGKQIAIKMISKKILQQDEYLQEYLEGEKQVMMSVKNRYVMELYAFEEDENYKYFVCQYCDGGDLFNFQAKQPNRVFELKSATRILSEVIQGLEKLHSMGYLHRDIKAQNILRKKQPNKDTYIYKLADFGFCKKNQKADGTVLGTQNYMSPEIYSNQIYSYEVDMWAFGVLLYFMLNMEFPFRINPHSEIEQKRSDLLKQCTNFSYTEVVKKSKKKIMENCTQQVNDLFRQIFTPKAQDRITFMEIRLHPLFKQYFPVIQNQSKILYKKNGGKINRYDSFVQAKMSVVVKKPNNTNDANKKPQSRVSYDDASPEPSFPKINTVNQNAQLDAELDRILFLKQMSESLRVLYGQLLSQPQIEAFRYNLIRYQIILLRDFRDSLTADILDKKYPKLKWKQFSKTKQFTSLKQKVKDCIDNAELVFTQSQYQCSNVLKEISKTNPDFQKGFEDQVRTKQFAGFFKKSYRSSTSRIYEIVRDKFSTGNNFSYMTALIVICHAFNQLIACTEEQLMDLFSDYVKQRSRPGKPVQFTDLKIWMSKSSKQQIKKVIKNILDAFFG